MSNSETACTLCMFLVSSWHLKGCRNVVTNNTKQFRVCGVKSRLSAEVVARVCFGCLVSNSTSFTPTLATLRVSVWFCLVVGSSCW